MFCLRLACAILLIDAAVAAGQAPVPPDQAPDVTVAIPDTAAPPEWELRIPVSVKPAPKAEVGRMTFRVAYPSPTLAYDSIKVTDQLEGSGFTLKTAAPVTKGDTGSIAVELLPTKSGKEILRSGVAFVLVFKVYEEAEEKDFPITAEDVKAWGPPPAAPELRAASERKAMFIVSPPGLPIFACYFYMH